jgi:exodeoxyribonuclease-3
VVDRGWRLDHVLANKAAAPIARFVGVNREAGIACSDHAPVVVEVATG